MTCKSSGFQQLRLLSSVCSQQQTDEVPDDRESSYEKCPLVWGKWFQTDAEWQSVGIKWHTVGEKRERPTGDTHREKDKIKVQEWDRENKRKCGGESFSVIHSHSREWLQGRNKRAGASLGLFKEGFTPPPPPIHLSKFAINSVIYTLIRDRLSPL